MNLFPYCHLKWSYLDRHEGQLGFIIYTHREMASFIRLQEVWTICRILKRDVSCKKYAPEWQRNSSKQSPSYSSSTTSSSESIKRDKHLSFGALSAMENDGRTFSDPIDERNRNFARQLSLTGQVPNINSGLSVSNPDEAVFSKAGNWDELMPMVEFAVDPSLLYSF